ncbi:ectoine/hydroxyectoine ABC transporter substrate-binding protein EhuB [Nocardioides panacisoli]|uniref:ectoine/hydroxyectoine ABC transporter substrate-binding protein EhuB n=1 Tax=Nocardioides panacisoli TaxID=627624 RepID=UPI001C62D4C6|nr:ectoine/hydroxyectoine ABC transporter substrate-binding protein EhuB [Nocardioides panacisoli]QYJ05320.1 ectoine/hydroxyectoine ABC transporter substrate-binding protein EhuB [Nocardioides panacisoli]
MRPNRNGRTRTKMLALTGVAALMSVGLAACGSDDGGGDGAEGDLPPKDETIQIGIANEQPYGYMGDDGEATGFSPDIARTVLEDMGYTDLEFSVVEFGQLISGINAGQFDMVAAGMYLNPERSKQVLFTDPNYCIPEGLAVAKGNPEGIESYATFRENSDLTLAVASGTVEVGYAESAGVPKEQVKTFSGIDQMYNALEAGEVDAVTGTAPTVDGQVKGRGAVEAIEPFYPEAAEGNDPIVQPCGGVAFNLEDQAFRDAFNDVLTEYKEDGTTEEIITGYPGFSTENVEQANELTADDFK